MADRQREAGLMESVAALDEHVAAMTAEASMLRHEVGRQRTRMVFGVYMLGAIVMFGGVLLSLAVLNRSTLNQINVTQDYLVECTSPGPRAPTADDPRTGHPCFDDAQARTAVAVQAIINAFNS